jgi:hypothetical protein
MRDPNTILPSTAARKYRQECKELSLLISQVLKEGAAAGWIRSDLNFQLVAESILGMIRGVPRHRREKLTVEAAARTIVAILLDGCRAGHRQSTRDSNPADLYGNAARGRP